MPDDGVDARPSPVTAGPGRIAPLDGLRAVFVVLVLFHHMVWAAPGYAAGWVKGGWTGVDGFFVLSGFLIGGLLFGELARTGRIAYATFVGRRFLRLYPALLVALVAMGAVTVLADHQPFAATWPSLRAGGLYAMNWPFAHHQALVIDYTHLWSLAVEFQFYLLLPLLLIVLAKVKAPPWSVAGVIGVVMACAWVRRVQLWSGPASFPLAYVSLDTRMDTLLWGVLVALAVRQGWLDDRHRLALRALAVPAVAWIAWVVVGLDSRSPFAYHWGLTISGLAHATLLAWVLLDGRTVVARVLASKPLTWLGARSYSIYLYHYPLYFYASRHLGRFTSRERVALVLVAVVVLADLSYRLVERPAFRLKDRLT